MNQNLLALSVQPGSLIRTQLKFDGWILNSTNLNAGLEKSFW